VGTGSTGNGRAAAGVRPAPRQPVAVRVRQGGGWPGV
jgi:hypothetical protein